MMLTLPSNLLGLSDPVVGPLNHLLSSRKKMTRKRIKPTILPMTMPTIASVLRAMISQIVIQLLHLPFIVVVVCLQQMKTFFSFFF